MLYKETATQVFKRDERAEGEKCISITKVFVVEPKGEGEMDMSRQIAYMHTYSLRIGYRDTLFGVHCVADVIECCTSR